MRRQQKWPLKWGRPISVMKYVVTGMDLHRETSGTVLKPKFILKFFLEILSLKVLKPLHEFTLTLGQHI